jgi:hypothetical protein
MGLDAVVYKHKLHLPADPEIQGLRVDPDTGELSCSDDMMKEYPQDFFQAKSKRLGNVSNISTLREEIEVAAGTIPSLLRSRVLYSATHSGDVIALSELDQLESELQMVRLKSGEQSSSFLQCFLQDLTELIASARAERNPIVFT